MSFLATLALGFYLLVNSVLSWPLTLGGVDMVSVQESSITTQQEVVYNSKGNPTRFTRDLEFVYFRDIRIEGADPETFSIIDYNYAKDRENVYRYTAWNWSILLDADPSTFEPIPASNVVYGKDNMYVYCYDIRIEGADSETFKISDYDEVYEAEDKDHKYVCGDVIDLDTLEVINTDNGEASGFARDKNYVYIEGINDHKYSVLSSDPGNFSLLGGDYSRDSTNVYWAGVVVPNADPETFESFAPYYYGRDAYHIYKTNKELDVDYETFEVLDYVYYKDKDSVRWSPFADPERRIIEADPATFEVVTGQSDYDAEDKNNRYKNGEVVETFDYPEGADIDTFTYDPVTLIAKDFQNVWVMGEVPPEFNHIPGADPKTFVSIGRPYYKDKNRAYCWFHPMPTTVDVTSLKLTPFDLSMNDYPESIDNRYAVDSTTVYYCRESVVGADVATFRTSQQEGGMVDAVDKDHTYHWGVVVE